VKTKLDIDSDWVAQVRALNRPPYLIFAAEGEADDDPIAEAWTCDTYEERNELVEELEDKYPDVHVSVSRSLQ
jgi:hypothetical protein